MPDAHPSPHREVVDALGAEWTSPAQEGYAHLQVPIRSCAGVAAKVACLST